MVLDTSVLIAILRAEPESERLLNVLQGAEVLRISAASLLEAAILIRGRYGGDGEYRLDRLIRETPISVEAVTVHQVGIAREAFRRFGKGRHPAALNFGDCFSYALAVALGEPLLFVGNDFARTDVLIASF